MVRDSRKFHYVLGIKENLVNEALFRRLCSYLGGDLEKYYNYDCNTLYKSAINGCTPIETRLQGSLKGFRNQYIDLFPNLNYLIIKKEKDEFSYITSNNDYFEEYILNIRDVSYDDVKQMNDYNKKGYKDEEIIVNIVLDNSNFAIVLYQYFDKNEVNKNNSDSYNDKYTIFENVKDEGFSRQFTGTLKEIVDHYDLDYKKFVKDINKLSEENNYNIDDNNYNYNLDNIIEKAIANPKNKRLYTVFKGTDEEFTGNVIEIADHFNINYNNIKRRKETYGLPLERCVEMTRDIDNPNDLN